VCHTAKSIEVTAFDTLAEAVAAIGSLGGEPCSEPRRRVHSIVYHDGERWHSSRLICDDIRLACRRLIGDAFPHRQQALTGLGHRSGGRTWLPAKHFDGLLS
jgi:hypothetical protein